MRKIVSVITALIVFVCAISLAACGKDLPPDDGTPDPGPLYGEFISSGNVLTFRADHVIDLDITEEFSKLSGLPAGKSEGTFVFLFHNEEWRYDKAEVLRITVNGTDHSFINAHGTTCYKTLAFYLSDDSMVSFDRTEE